MLTFSEYQNIALETVSYPRAYTTIYPALALSEEAGEVSGKIAKWLRGDFPLDAAKKEEVAKELGDVLWNIAALSFDIGYNLNEIATLNLSKLRDRRDRGVIRGSGDSR